MKVPKYIEEALKRRAKAAVTFTDTDSVISEFIEKHGIDCEYTHLHCESLLNPYVANSATVKAIEEKEN